MPTDVIEVDARNADEGPGDPMARPDCERGVARGVDREVPSFVPELGEPAEVDGEMPLAFCMAWSWKGRLGFLLNIVISFLRLMTC